MLKYFVLLAVALVSSAVMAEEIIGGLGDYPAVSVETGEKLTQSDPVAISPALDGLSKTGGGEYVLPSDKVVFADKFKLKTGDGTSEYRFTGTSGAIDYPMPSVMSNAAFWVDASLAGAIATTVTTNITDNGDGTATTNFITNAETWYDVRDVDAVVAGGAGVYTRATASRYLLFGDNNETRVPSVVTVQGRKAVSFGCARTGRYMMWRSPSGGTNRVNSIMHLFAVNCISNTWGYILGSHQTGTENCAPGSSTYSNPASLAADPLWGKCNKAILAGRTFQNGVLVDGTTCKAKIGYHLLEFDTLGGVVDGTDCFFNDRDYEADSNNASKIGGNRVGGDYLSEVLVFTNRLTETQRMQIETYLMCKWQLNHSDSSDVTLLATSGTVSSVSAAAGVDFDVSAIGAGAINIGSSAVRFLQPMQDDRLVIATKPVTPLGSFQNRYPKVTSVAAAGKRFNGSVRLEGTHYVNIPVALSVHAGEVVTAANAISGTAVTVASGDVGKIVKRGLSSVSLSKVPSDANILAVEKGTLRLVAPGKDDDKVGSSIGTEAYIPNADFEDDDVEYDSHNYCSLPVGTTKNGWTGAGTWAWDSYAGYSKLKDNGTPGTYSSYGFNLPKPHGGKCQLNVQYKMSAYATITVYKSGVYELGFWCGHSNWESSKQLHFDIKIGVDKDHLTTIGKVISYGDKSYKEYKLLTPKLEPGEYQLWLSNNNKAQTAAVFDDFKMVCVADEVDDSNLLTNGDFEDFTRPLASMSFSEAALGNASSGWIFTQADDYTSGTPNVALVTPFAISTAEALYWDMPGYKSGAAAVAFRKPGGTISKSQISLPAGTYQVRARLSRQYVFNNSDCSGTPVLAASVTPEGGSAIDLGSVTVSRRLTERREWPNTFTLAAASTVTISFTQTAKAVLFADDFEIVRHSASSNMLKNGGFESGTSSTTDVGNWQNVNIGGSGNSRLEYKKDYGADMYFTQNYFEGTFCFCINRRGLIRQQVAFPKAGVYRLVFHAQPRCHIGSETTYCWNPVEAKWLKDNGNGTVTTNVIGVTSLENGEEKYRSYIRYDWTFRVPVAGTYPLVIQGGNASGDYNMMLDAVSLTAVDDSDGASVPVNDEVLEVNVDTGAKMRLDYTGTMKVKRLTLGGERIRSSEIGSQGSRAITVSAATHPDYFYGAGSIKVINPGLGTVILVR